MRLAQSALRYWIEGAARALCECCGDQWFDYTRNVRTSRDVELTQAGMAGAEIGDGHMYQPARPAHIRRAMRELPVRDFSEFSYIDLGSGKGRTLFIAAEFPFREVIGVEFSRVLHEQATRNIRAFPLSRRRSGQIVSVHANARNFAFPDHKLVLYLFNPFGAETMQQVLGNLSRSIERHRRHILIVLLWPRCQQMVAALAGMRLIRERRQYQIFEAYRVPE